MSEAIELYKQDGTAAGVFYCSECRAVFPNQNQAQACHGERICECGKKIEQRYRDRCNECDSREWRAKCAEKELERYEKAEKIPWSAYKRGMIYDGDNYYEDLEDVLDKYEEGQEPEYVWACKDIGVRKLHVEDVLENILEGMWEDADGGDLNGVVELDTAIREFNEANESISVWEVDYSTAILVEKEAKEITDGTV